MYPVIPITSSVVIPTYYFILSLTICIGLLWIIRRAQRFHLSRKIALDLSLIIMISGFVGGRLFHVFYEDFSYYREDPWRVLQIWNGGFIFYGGALLAGLFSFIYLSLKEKRHLKKYLDLFAPVLSLSYVLGRLACLFAGCCYGRTCELPWAIAGRHPTQIYAAVWELGTLIILLGIEKTPRIQRPLKNLRNPGSIFFLWMILHGIGRLLMESYRDDFRGPTLGISISSWISLVIIVYGSFLLIRSKHA